MGLVLAGLRRLFRSPVLRKDVTGKRKSKKNPTLCNRCYKRCDCEFCTCNVR